jgi:AcrR family transcriptional regulator
MVELNGLEVKMVNDGTEQKILEASLKIFRQKGYAGTKMQKIADEAHINKAALNYYFRSKENLFKKVFELTFREIFPKIGIALNVEGDFFKKVDKFIEVYIDFLFENIQLIHFVISEIHMNAPIISDILLTQNPSFNPHLFLAEMQKEMDAGRLNKVNPQHFFINLISMCVFPFLSKEIFGRVFKMSDEEVFEFLKARKIEVSKFVRAALEVR